MLLTETRCQIIVEVSNLTPMRISSTPSRHPVSLWQLVTCVLLAGLFLYNPFLAANPSFGSASVCHPPSYRATVGSSELEQLRLPTAGVVPLLLPNVYAVQVFIRQMAAGKAESRCYIEQVVVANPRTGFSSSLWFRPPPAV
jgi:hypothetical protein